MSELYTVTPGNPTYASDLNQVVQTLNGALDPGALTFSGPIAAPGAPSVTLATGSLTGTYSWVAWWITGVLDGTGGNHTNGDTPYGTATTAQALSSQEAVVSAPASPPSQAIGWGLGRTANGGSTYYVVATAYQTTAGTWPQITDDTPDSSLTVLAPTANTTGTPVDFNAGSTLANGQKLSALEAGGTSRTVAYMDASDVEHLGDATNTDATLLHGATVKTSKGAVTVDDGSGNASVRTLASTVATGTAPLSVASTTQVANLNAAGLGGTVEITLAQLFLGFGNTTYGVALFSAQTSASATVLEQVGSVNTGGQQPVVSIQSLEPAASYYFEACGAATAGTGYAGLWDNTAGALVTGSTVTLGGYGSPVRSGAITLTAGHNYSATLWNSGTGNTLVSAARIVAEL